MRRLFIAATGQDRGKTTIALGLFHLCRERGLRAAFIKPVGQRYMEEDGWKVDEDAVLMRRVFSCDEQVQHMSPVAIERGFTERYIFNRDRRAIEKEIAQSFAHLEGHDVALIEGTGHVGVGSVFDTSNAVVAKQLQAKAVIVSGGGIGSSIDEICLNKSPFEQAGVEVLGAIVNKVLPEKYERVSKAVRQGLENAGVRCLGVLPFEAQLTLPTVHQLMQELGVKVLCGEEGLGTRIRNVIVAAMAPQNAITYIRNSALVITPGDRIDNILVAISAHTVGKEANEDKVSAILLTGGFIPHFTIMDLLKRARVPVLSSEDHTADVARKVQSMTVKITDEDPDKIEDAIRLVRECVDFESLLGLA